MTLQELNETLTKILKQFIKDREHIDTGAMYKSIKFKCTYSSEAGIRIKFSSKYYIKYLEEGTFVSDFFALPVVNDTIATFLAFQIEQDLIGPFL